jgi:hypothetical protein
VPSSCKRLSPAIANGQKKQKNTICNITHFTISATTKKREKNPQISERNCQKFRED